MTSVAPTSHTIDDFSSHGHHGEPSRENQQHQQQLQQSVEQRLLTRKSPFLVSSHEEMNPSRRSSMEDCSIYAAPGTWDAPDEEMAYVGVYDGHGGRSMVEYLEYGLSFHVAQELHCQDNSTILERLERAFLMADIHSRQLGVTTSGATVAVCLIKKHPNTRNVSIYAANAGDARIVLGHQGKASRLTKDHRPEDPDEVDRINRAGGFMFKGRVIGVLATTRSLGDHCMKNYVIAEPYCYKKDIELSPMQLDVEDSDGEDSVKSEYSFVICACDGLWDVLKDQEAVDFVSRHQHDKENVARHLVNEALRKGSTDNISVQVAWL